MQQRGGWQREPRGIFLCVSWTFDIKNVFSIIRIDFRIGGDFGLLVAVEVLKEDATHLKLVMTFFFIRTEKIEEAFAVVDFDDEECFQRLGAGERVRDVFTDEHLAGIGDFESFEVWHVFLYVFGLSGGGNRTR